MSTDSHKSNDTSISRGLRVIIITQGVSRITYPILNSKHSVVGIIESAPRGYKVSQSFLKKIYRLFIFLKYLLEKNPKTLRNLCRKKKIPYWLMKSCRENGLKDWIEKLNPEVIVVYGMSQLLKSNIYSIPKFGSINLHPSMLPDYRGPNPDFWQYYDMELMPGVTVHHIDDGEDTGDIIYQERVSIPLGIKSPQRLDIMVGKVGVNLILKALEAIKIKQVPRISQEKKSPTARARNILLQEHENIIDWNTWSVERIWNILCGTESWLNVLPQPCRLFCNKRWVICEYEKDESQDYEIKKIYKVNGGYFIAAKDGKIFLKKKFNVKSIIKRILINE